MIDVGVPNPTQGQAIISTHSRNQCQGDIPIMLYQMMKVAIATAITAGTNSLSLDLPIAELVLWNPALVEPVSQFGQETYLYPPSPKLKATRFVNRGSNHLIARLL